MKTNPHCVGWSRLKVSQRGSTLPAPAVRRDVCRGPAVAVLSSPTFVAWPSRLEVSVDSSRVAVCRDFKSKEVIQ